MSKYSKQFEVKQGDIVRVWGQDYIVFTVGGGNISTVGVAALVNLKYGTSLSNPLFYSKGTATFSLGDLLAGVPIGDVVSVKRGGVVVSPVDPDPNEIELEPGDVITRATGTEYTYVEGVEGSALVAVDEGRFWYSGLRNSNRLSGLAGPSWGKTSRIVDRKGKIKYLAE